MRGRAMTVVRFAGIIRGESRLEAGARVCLLTPRAVCVRLIIIELTVIMGDWLGLGRHPMCLPSVDAVLLR